MRFYTPYVLLLLSYMIYFNGLNISFNNYNEIIEFRNIKITICNKDICNAYAFYYCPAMEQEYDYRQMLGSDNNFIRNMNYNGEIYCKIPKQHINGSKQLIRATGFEPYDIALSALINASFTKVTLTPKIYENRIILTKKNGQLSIKLEPEITDSINIH